MNQAFQKNKVARINPYHSVLQVVLPVIQDKKYIGVKMVRQIPKSLIDKFEKTDKYIHHTYDAHSWGGRAIDIQIANPITGRFMSGSSSGTAVNVFCGINDLGIGTDGGGSVLAPAMSLNLFAFISPLIERKYLTDFAKVSTDNIIFTPSIGFITRTYEELIQAVLVVLPITKVPSTKQIVIQGVHDRSILPFKTKRIKYPDIYGQREPLITFLQKELSNCDVLISKEGPIDLAGIGDSVFGSFKGICEEQQIKANKGLLRVVNMANASAICIPTKDLSTAYVLICASELHKINYMLYLAETLIVDMPEIVERYFQNLNMYDE